MKYSLLGLVFFGLTLSASAAGADMVAGPVAADVVEVVDGATIVVDAHTWPGVTVQATVILRGIAAPKPGGACGRERGMAATARDKLVELLDGFGNRVDLSAIEATAEDAVVIADVTSYGINPGYALINYELARRDDGPVSWCD